MKKKHFELSTICRFCKNGVRLLALFCITQLIAPGSVAQGVQMKQNKREKISITIGKTELIAVIDGTKTSQDFLSLLPLDIKMNDLFGREKYAKLPRSISKEGQQIQTYEVGDIAYWSAGPDVAIYYRQDGERIESGLYKIGHIESGVDAFNVPGSVNVKFARKPE